MNYKIIAISKEDYDATNKSRARDMALIVLKNDSEYKKLFMRQKKWLNTDLIQWMMHEKIPIKVVRVGMLILQSNRKLTQNQRKVLVDKLTPLVFNSSDANPIALLLIYFCEDYPDIKSMIIDHWNELPCNGVVNSVPGAVKKLCKLMTNGKNVFFLDLLSILLDPTGYSEPYQKKLVLIKNHLLSKGLLKILFKQLKEIQTSDGYDCRVTDEEFIQISSQYNEYIRLYKIIVGSLIGQSKQQVMKHKRSLDTVFEEIRIRNDHIHRLKAESNEAISDEEIYKFNICLKIILMILSEINENNLFSLNPSMDKFDVIEVSLTNIMTNKDMKRIIKKQLLNVLTDIVFLEEMREPIDEISTTIFFQITGKNIRFKELRDDKRKEITKSLIFIGNQIKTFMLPVIPEEVKEPNSNSTRRWMNTGIKSCVQIKPILQKNQSKEGSKKRENNKAVSEKDKTSREVSQEWSKKEQRKASKTGKKKKNIRNIDFRFKGARVLAC